MLGVCDKIVPGLLIGALSFGHLPTVFVPAGPMASGLPNGEKARVRQLYAEGKVGRDELLDAEAASYHSAGHLHVLRHRQLQPAADGGARAAPARLVASSTRARRCATALTRGGRPSAPSRSPGRAASPRRSARSSTRRRSSTRASRCWPAAARPTTRCTWSRSRAPPASPSPGTTCPTSRPWCRCWPGSTPTARPT